MLWESFYKDLKAKNCIFCSDFSKIVRYNHEVYPIKHAKPNQAAHFVRYKRVFVITVITIIEIDYAVTVPRKLKIK
jgi:hypothetical protein